MRKFLRVSALAALAAGALVVTAQAQYKQVGLVAGANFATLNGDDISDGAGTRTGFVGGLVVGIPVGDGNLSIEPQALYSMQGATYDNAFYKGTYKADYIKVPLLVKWAQERFGKGLYIFAGPSVGFNVSCNDSGDVVGGGSYDGSCEDEDGIKAKTTFSGDVGLGFGNGKISIEGRYSFDWGSAFEDAETGESYDVKNSVISVMVRVSK